MVHTSIKNLNKGEQPREKLLNHTASYLTNEELLAILIDSGTKEKNALDIARELLQKDANFSQLTEKNISELTTIKGLGVAKASKICASMEICKRIKMPNVTEKITKAQDVVNYIKKDLYNKKKEYLYVVSTDVRNHIISKDLISIGTVSETLISPREIFKTSLVNNAAGIVLIHNHPSNDPKPSLEDIEVTSKIYSGSILLGITLLDHVIVTNHKYFSMRENNLIGKEVK